jgi:hypothetical protein
LRARYIAHFLPVCYNLIALLFIPQLAHVLNMVLLRSVVDDIHLATTTTTTTYATIFF